MSARTVGQMQALILSTRWKDEENWMNKRLSGLMVQSRIDNVRGLVNYSNSASVELRSWNKIPIGTKNHLENQLLKPLMRIFETISGLGEKSSSLRLLFHDWF